MEDVFSREEAWVEGAPRRFQMRLRQIAAAYVEEIRRRGADALPVDPDGRAIVVAGLKHTVPDDTAIMAVLEGLE